MLYPDLPSHPDHALAKKLLPHGSGAIFAFDLKGGREAGKRFIERLHTQPACDIDMAGVDVEPVRPGQPQKVFTENDLHVRHFMRAQSKRLIRKGQFRAA